MTSLAPQSAPAMAHNIALKGWKQRLPTILVHGFFLTYIVLAIWSYRERTVGDVPYFVFKLANYETFFLLRRWIFFFLELPALTAVQLGASLETVTILYSLGLPILLYTVAILLIHRLDDIYSAVAVAVLLTTGSANLFYWPIEQTIVLALCILLFSMLKSIDLVGLRLLQPKVILTAALTVLIAYSYPAAIIFIAFVVGLHILRERRFSKVHALLLVICGIYVFTNVVNANEYESSILSAEGAGLSVSLDYWLDVGRFVLERYAFILILLMATVIYYTISRVYLKAAYVLISYIGYMLLVNYIYNINGHSTIYLEHVYEATMIFVLIPLFGDVAPRLGSRSKTIFNLAILAAIMIGMVAIMQHREQYQSRIDFMQRLMNAPDTAGMSKLILSDTNADPELDPFRWSHGFASFLISSITSDNPPRTVVFEKWYPVYSIPENYLNPKYFRVDSSSYQRLNNPGSVSSVDDNFVANVDLKINSPGTRHQAGSEFRLPVTIANNNSTPLHSGFSDDYRLQLAYHWLDDSGIVVWDGLRTPLEMDITSAYSQPMKIRSPEQPGDYTLVVDLVLEGIRWFGLDAEAMIQVQ